MAIRLNGWQRLWVVVSMLWRLVVRLIVFTAWPMPSSAEEHIRPADPNGWTPVPEGFYAALANLSGDNSLPIGLRGRCFQPLSQVPCGLTL
jgi:hypothetical protein